VATASFHHDLSNLVDWPEDVIIAPIPRAMRHGRAPVLLTQCN